MKRSSESKWLVLLLILFSTAGFAASFANRPVNFEGRTRRYCWYVPDSATIDAPLLVILHGSTQRGCEIAKLWTAIADREGLLLVAPDSLGRLGWDAAADSPMFLRAVLDDAQQQHPFNAQRVYLFGYSSGGHFALLLSLLEGRYFAATAVFGGALLPKWEKFIPYHERAIPIIMFQGTDDPIVPLWAARNTRDLLQRNGLRVQLREQPHVTHDYEPVSAEVNEAAWSFLQTSALSEPPHFKEWQTRKPNE